MRIVIFGASGATGKQLIDQALRRQWQVTAFVRDPARLNRSGVTIKLGDVGDPTAVAAAIAGQDAVLSALGVGKALKADPVVVDGVRHILAAMRVHDVRRLVYLSTIAVRESRAAAGWIIRHIGRHPLRHEIADHEAKEAMIKASDLDWTIVRAPLLTNGPRTGHYRSGDEIASGALLPKLSRADVAEFMLSELADAKDIRRAPRLLPVKSAVANREVSVDPV